MLSVALAHLITDDRKVAASHRASELEAQSRVVHFINLDGHNFLKLPYLLLNLNGFRGLIAETFYEGFCVCNLLLLILEGTKLLLAAFCMERDIFVVLHLVVVDFAATDFDSTIRYIINKRAIMADEHNCIRTCGKEVLEPLNALNVEVIRWLIEEKHIRMLKQQLCQLNTHSPASAELARRAVQVLSLEAKTLQSSFQFCLIIQASHHLEMLVQVREAFH